MKFRPFLEVSALHSARFFKLAFDIFCKNLCAKICKIFEKKMLNSVFRNFFCRKSNKNCKNSRNHTFLSIYDEDSNLSCQTKFFRFCRKKLPKQKLNLLQILQIDLTKSSNSGLENLNLSCTEKCNFFENSTKYCTFLVKSYQNFIYSG